MRDALAGLAVTVPFALGVLTGAPAPTGTQVLTFADPAIVEASDLVVQDGLFLTTNDSGDSGRVFAVDDAGTTVGVTHWAQDPTDVEGLAPGGPGFVWVGDIGDNLGHRSTVSVTRVPVGRGDRTVQETTYLLAYPHHARPDAETLVRDPATGRLYIATKNIFGGVLYEVPANLSATGTNRLRAVGDVIPVATDGAFFTDGRYLVVRNYTSAVVYAWPSMRIVGQVGLPAQHQGEGIAVAADGSVYVSSEGVRSEVLRVALPPAVRRKVGSASPSPSATPSSTPAAHASDPSSPTDPQSQDAWPWVAGGLVAVVGLLVLLRALRPR